VSERSKGIDDEIPEFGDLPIQIQLRVLAILVMKNSPAAKVVASQIMDSNTE